MSLVAPSRTWADVERFYAELYERDPRWAPMVSIVRYLRRPPFDATLFATTSMYTLCLGQTRSIRWDDNVLRIESGPGRDAVTFEYPRWPQPGLVRPGCFEPWRTTVAGCDAVARLERILCKRLRWYRAVEARDARPPHDQPLLRTDR